MIGRRALAGAIGAVSACLALIPLLGIPPRTAQATACFVISPFERPGGKVVFVSVGRDLAAFALPPGPGSPLGPFSSLFSSIPLKREARSLLWSAAEVWSKSTAGRPTIRSRQSPAPPEPEAIDSARRAELGILAEGALVSTPNQVSYFLLDLDGYASFVHRERNRRSVLFAAGSDGLIHAFDAGSDERADPGSGSEIFAYAPRGVVSAGDVDGRISFDDAFLDAPWAGGGVPCARGADPSSVHCQWRTIVAAGLGRGGRTVFALDVTRPDSEPARGPRPGLFDCVPGPGRTPDARCGGAYPTVLWEFSDDSDEDGNGRPDLGFTTSAPSFGRVRLRNARTKRVEDHAVLFFGGGSDLADPAGTRGSERRSGNWLYVVDLESGRLLYKTSFGLARSQKAGRIGTARRSFGSIPSALSTFDLDQDGYTDAVYFGDSLGQLWKLLIPESDATVAEYDPSPRSGRKGGRIANGVSISGGRSAEGAAWCPVLLFDGRDGMSGPGSTPPGVLHPPVLVRAGSNGRGEPIYGVVWATSAPTSSRDDSAVARVSVLWDPGLGGNGASVREDPIARSLASGTGEPLSLIEGPGAPETGSCERRGAVRTQGWSLGLGPGESIASDLVVFDGYIYVLASPVAKVGSGDRLYRLDLETGDACHGTDCCTGSTGFWNPAHRADGNQDRGLRLASDLQLSTTALRTFVADDGSRRIGLIGQTTSGSGIPAVSLVTRPISTLLIRRGRREP